METPHCSRQLYPESIFEASNKLSQQKHVRWTSRAPSDSRRYQEPKVPQLQAQISKVNWTFQEYPKYVCRLQLTKAYSKEASDFPPAVAD